MSVRTDLNTAINTLITAQVNITKHRAANQAMMDYVDTLVAARRITLITVTGTTTKTITITFGDSTTITATFTDLNGVVVNDAPTVSSVALTASSDQQGVVQTVSYIYADTESDASATPIIRWQRADSDGSNVVVISGATSTTYTPGLSDVGKKIRAGVTPVAATGTTTGIEVFSTYTSTIIAASDTVPPAVVSVAVANGTPSVVDVTFDEALSGSHIPLFSDFIVEGHTTTGTVTITGSVAHVPVTTAFINGETIRHISYTPGLTANKLQDANSNLVIAFSGQSITNNVATPPITVRLFYSSTNPRSALLANTAPTSPIRSTTLVSLTDDILVDVHDMTPEYYPTIEVPDTVELKNTWVDTGAPLTVGQIPDDLMGDPIVFGGKRYYYFKVGMTFDPGTGSRLRLYKI